MSNKRGARDAGGSFGATGGSAGSGRAYGPARGLEASLANGSAGYSGGGRAGGQSCGSSAPKTRADGGKRADRAAQFMPFAALTGYYELARKQEHIVEPKHELTEEEALALSHELAQARKGELLRVTFYDWDGYVTRTGVVEQIEVPYRRLRLSGKVIPFDDILKIKRQGRA